MLVSLLFLGLALCSWAEVVQQDPMAEHANSFGWLAIRNFTFCMSNVPDPANKPLGVQPPSAISTASGTRKRRISGMGDSVVVLYHPEQTNQPIAWCNTLVAFTSTDHMRCHTALPTCQRCDAVRSSSTAETPTTNQPAQLVQPAQPVQPDGAGAPPPGSGSGGDKNSGEEIKGGDQKGGKDVQGETKPNDAGSQDGKGGVQADTEGGLVPLRKRDKRSAGGQAKRGGVKQDPLSDAELQEAIGEFQDFCENKLTLAVRADCPLHVVTGWRDEPPFDLHRFCSSIGNEIWGDNNIADRQADASKRNEEKRRPSVAKGTGGTGAFDPTDPVVPSPDDKPAGSTAKGAKRKRSIGRTYW